MTQRAQRNKTVNTHLKQFKNTQPINVIHKPELRRGTQYHSRQLKWLALDFKKEHNIFNQSRHLHKLDK